MPSPRRRPRGKPFEKSPKNYLSRENKNQDSSKQEPRKRDFRKKTAEIISLRTIPGKKEWEFAFPRCVAEREEDLSEVRMMMDAGEYELARDELRWLLEGCDCNIEAHRLLGELALMENDETLARGHFGYAYELGIKAMPPEGPPGVIPYGQRANQAFFESGKALAWCLHNVGKTSAAQEVVDLLLRCDPSDPLGVKTLLSE